MSLQVARAVEAQVHKTGFGARCSLLSTLLLAVLAMTWGCSGIVSGSTPGPGPAQTHSLTGTITPTTGGGGATVTLSGAANATTNADGAGVYTFSGLPDGSYTVTPTRTGYIFSPNSQAATVAGANVTGVNFTAAAQGGQTFAISGTISPSAGGSGATVTLSGAASATTTANSSGAYTFTGLANGTYTVTPSHTGYTFGPTSLTAIVNGANVTGVNFTAAAQGGQTFAISGTISPSAGGSGATVTLSGAATATTTTDASGAYTFTGLSNGAYAVTPSKSGYSFSPSSVSATINGANVAGLNFTISAAGISVSLAPTLANILPGATQNFTATVSGTSNTAVTWSASGGTITGSGGTVTYTAPSTPASYTVTATSVADTTKSTSATVVVGPSGTGVYVPPSVDRVKTQLNGTWKFVASDTLTGAEAPAFDDSTWSSVSVPHTWDTPDVVTAHSHSWYRTHIAVPAADAGKRVYVEFEGVFQVADVYVNGIHLGQHRGGYTRFVFDASSAIQFGADNVLAVMVSSASCSDCLPDGSPRLWKGFGGIYRKAWLIETNRYHVYPDFASTGIYITPSNVSSSSANVSIRTVVKNSDAVSKTFTVKNVLTDASDNILLTVQQSVTVAANTTADVVQYGSVSNPQLWSKNNPYLYKVNAETWVDGIVSDWVQEHTGFRAFQLSSSDFTLNGVSTKLRGIAKHQETEYAATAVSDVDLRTDWDNLQDLGVNFVRLVHYPHSEFEYDLADQRGIMVWAENGHTNGGAETSNGDNINRELIYQNWNHPSVIFWSAGNEASNTSATSGYAAVLRATDTSRPVVYASNGQTPSNVDFIFKNTYEGWYGGSMYGFETSGNHWISESGAGMVVGTHTANSFAMNYTIDSYEPEEYGTLVNEVKFQTMFVTQPSRIPAFVAWVFREISDTKYKGNINTKGFLTYSNHKKDIYYLYKSFLTTTPVVHIVGPDYFLRDGADVKVYSNAANVTLTVNGISQGVKTDGSYSHPNGTVINRVFYWTNVLQLGKNVLTADDGLGHRDTVTVYYKGGGQAMPVEAGAKVANLTSSNSANFAFFMNIPVTGQLPFYYDFDGNGDNTFDVLPSVLTGSGWIATKRQSDALHTTNLTFDLPFGGDVYVMVTKQSSIPAWITSAGLADTGVVGKWRDNNLSLADYQLFMRTFPAGSHIALGSSAIDFLVMVK